VIACAARVSPAGGVVVSVTCVLVPVPHAEAEALVVGDSSAWERLTARASTFRPRVARVDAIREELHTLLFPRWQGARPPSVVDRLRAFFRQRPEPTIDFAAYDPYVHLFGRSLPLRARSASSHAERLAAAVAANEDAFASALAADLASLDPRAAELFARTPVPTIDVIPRIDRLRRRVAACVSGSESLKPAWDAVVRALAISGPVWRFDGEQLGDLLHTLGVGTEIGDASSLLRDAGLPETRLTDLPKALGDFVGAGGFLSAGLAMTLGASLKLNRRRILANVRADGDAEAITLRHARLLEEALATCTHAGAGLAEAAGVEWHDAWND